MNSSLINMSDLKKYHDIRKQVKFNNEIATNKHDNEQVNTIYKT